MSATINKTTTDIASLIPQRFPIMMVSEYGYEDGDKGWSKLHIANDNIFLGTDGHMMAEGLLEHIAQTAAAHIGFKHRLAGEEVGVGFIGDIKRCSVNGPMPMAGDSIKTDIKIISQVGNITMISAETKLDDNVIVSCRMKLTD